MHLKQLEGVPGVYHPADWGESEIMHLRMAYNEGKRHGAQEVRDPIIEALGIDRMIDSVYVNIEGNQ